MAVCKQIVSLCFRQELQQSGEEERELTVKLDLTAHQAEEAARLQKAKQEGLQQDLSLATARFHTLSQHLQQIIQQADHQEASLSEASQLQSRLSEEIAACCSQRDAVLENLREGCAFFGPLIIESKWRCISYQYFTWKEREKTHP